MSGAWPWSDPLQSIMRTEWSATSSLGRGGAVWSIALMTAPETATSRPPPADPVLREALMELVALGVRLARVAAEVAEVEGRVVAVVAAGLPGSLDGALSLDEARDAGLAVDSAETALAQASARIGTAAQAFDRASRAVRRTVALVQRIDAGWRPQGGSDNHGSLVRRQAARSVGERITREHDGEAAERLFDDLAERLDALELDGGLDRPAEMVIAELCRELGLAGLGPVQLRDPAQRTSAPGPTPVAGDDPDG